MISIFYLKTGAQVFKPLNGGKVPISLSYVNSKDKFKFFHVFLKLWRVYLLLPHQIYELLLHKKTYRESLVTSLSLLKF